MLIKETWPGFAGFRFLRVGDVVLGTGGDQPTRAPTVPELRAEGVRLADHLGVTS